MLDFDPFDDFRKSFSDRRSAGDFFRPSRSFSPSRNSFEDNLNVWGFASSSDFSGNSSSDFDDNFDNLNSQSGRDDNSGLEANVNRDFPDEDYERNPSDGTYSPDFISADSTPLSHISPSNNDDPSTDFWEKLVAGARDNTEETRRREKARRQALLRKQQELARQEEAQRQQRLRHQEELWRQEEMEDRRREMHAQTAFNTEEASINQAVSNPYYDDGDDQRTLAFQAEDLNRFEDTSTQPSPAFNTSRYEFTEEGRDGEQPWHATSEGRRPLRGMMYSSSLRDQSTTGGSGIRPERFSTQESARAHYQGTQSTQSRSNTQPNRMRNAGRLREDTFSSQSRAQYYKSVNDSTNPGPERTQARLEHTTRPSYRSPYPLENMSLSDDSSTNERRYPEALVTSDETHIRSYRPEDVENTLLGAYKPLRRRDANLQHVLEQDDFNSSTQQSAYVHDRTGTTYPNPVNVSKISSQSTQRAHRLQDETASPHEFSSRKMPVSAQLSEDYINSDKPSMDRSTRKANYPRLPERTHSANNTRQGSRSDRELYSTQSSQSRNADFADHTSSRENNHPSRPSENQSNTNRAAYTQVLPKMENAEYQNNSSDAYSSYSSQSLSSEAYYSQQGNYMPAQSPDVMPVASTPSIRNFAQHFDNIFKRLRQVIIGKDWQLRLLLVSLFAQGHILIEDVPGTGKTRLAQTLAQGIDIRFNRIQFTGDLNPSDIIGVTLYSSETQEFRFKKGPIFTNILLADELNRATPKTQAILLEAMGERTVTTWHETYELPSPFMVIATEDPQEYVGTYPLPQGEIDRFLIKMALGYPDLDSSLKILRESISGESTEILNSPPVLTTHEVTAMQQIASRVHADDAILRYVMAIVEETRQSDEIIKNGVSIRGALGLIRAAKVWAAAQGRSFVSPKDIRAMSIPVLSHRLELTAQALYSGQTAEVVLQNLLTKIPAPISYTPNPYVSMSRPASPRPLPNMMPNILPPRSIPPRSLPLRPNLQPHNVQSVLPQDISQENININNNSQGNMSGDAQENASAISPHMPAIPAYRPRQIFPHS